eukprot:1304532-Pleurochrysis_carterae.AAC.2
MLARILTAFSNAARSFQELLMHVRWQRFREDVPHIVIRPDFALLNAAMCYVLLHLQVAAIDVA